MTKLRIQEVDDGVTFEARVVAGSSKTTVCGLLDTKLKVRISAPAEKGKANQCLIDFLAKKLGVKKNDVTIIAGKTNPVKAVHVLGISVDTLLKKLNLK